MTQSGMLASARNTISARSFLSGDSPRRFQITPSAKTMKPVHAIGVCQDQNGSILASMPASEIAMIPRPTIAESGNRRIDSKLSFRHRHEHVVAVAPHEHERGLAVLHFLELSRDLADVLHLLAVHFEDDVAEIGRAHV